MRIIRFVAAFSAAACIALSVAGCAQMAAKQAMTNAATCIKDVRESPEGKIVYTRLWVNDGSDTADKLTDTKPLNQTERNALVQVHHRLQACRQIIISHDNQYAAWETPYWQELFERGDAVFAKLVSGEISVAVANKLAIESFGKFQTDISRGHAQAVREDEIRQQRAAEALLQASAMMLATQPRPQTTATNCSWLGNNLNCMSSRF